MSVFLHTDSAGPIGGYFICFSSHNCVLESGVVHSIIRHVHKEHDKNHMTKTV